MVCSSGVHRWDRELGLGMCEAQSLSQHLEKYRYVFVRVRVIVRVVPVMIGAESILPPIRVYSISDSASAHSLARLLAAFFILSMESSRRVLLVFSFTISSACAFLG